MVFIEVNRSGCVFNNIITSDRFEANSSCDSTVSVSVSLVDLTTHFNICFKYYTIYLHIIDQYISPEFQRVVHPVRNHIYPGILLPVLGSQKQSSNPSRNPHIQ